MFCPKCGTENPDNGKFCRSCGANLSNVLAVVEGDLAVEETARENYADSYSSGIRNIILGFGFLFAAIFLFVNTQNDKEAWLLMLIPGFFLLASGISRVVKADALKKERKTKINIVPQKSFPANQANKELSPTQTDYISPQKSKFQTEDLSPEPLSVTEETTRQLQINTENKL